jgi:NAD(P)-dependent dehydrogenase (short-subunit alcohol dehydrogenase family)
VTQDVNVHEAVHAGPLLAGRIAVVTGGGGGIGAATARLFAQHGARVVIADIDADRGRRTADEITAAGGSALAITTDVRDADQVIRLARSVLDRHGRVDVLVNNVATGCGIRAASPIATHSCGMSSTGSTCTTFCWSPTRSFRR